VQQLQNRRDTPPDLIMSTEPAARQPLPMATFCLRGSVNQQRLRVATSEFSLSKHCDVGGFSDPRRKDALDERKRATRASV
jgi:hypothetical protein